MKSAKEFFSYGSLLINVIRKLWGFYPPSKRSFRFFVFVFNDRNNEKKKTFIGPMLGIYNRTAKNILPVAKIKNIFW